MSLESANDAFERRYIEAFRALAAKHGVIAKYERDRAARDIGLHLFRARKDGSEAATGSLIWFQFKGVQESTLSAEEFMSKPAFSVPIRVKDLQLWYRTNGPTYLVVYIESADSFFIVDVLGFVDRRYGQQIFSQAQDTVSVPVDRTSVLDERAFEQMLLKGDLQEWARIVPAEPSEVGLCMRDYSIIWRLATAADRGVEHKLEITDWQSKLRGEVALFERKETPDATWNRVREHWEFMFGVDGLESSYPYLSFSPSDEEHQADCEWDNVDANPSFELSDGTVVYGTEASGEYIWYELRPSLNPFGNRLWGFVEVLISAGVIQAPGDGDEMDGLEFVDVAPWHRRDI